MKIQLTPQEIHETKFFIEFFSKIPEDDWCTKVVSQVSKNESKTRYCAIGHLCSKIKDMNEVNEHYQKLVTLLHKVPLEMPERKINCIAAINDNVQFAADKFGDTPKKRIVNALKSLLEE